MRATSTPIFKTLAPGVAARFLARTARDKLGGTAENGYLHCGPNGAGHFVKMVHNGIEYGLMAAYAEGFGVLRGRHVGKSEHAADAETTPPSATRSTISTISTSPTSPSSARGSVIASWLLDLTAPAGLTEDPCSRSSAAACRIPARGGGRIKAAIDEAVPAHVLTAALYERFSSRGEADFAGQAALGDAL